jgi:putative aldouronate transport system substrate-binding protein
MKRADGHIYIAEIFGTPTGEQRVLNHSGSAFWLQKDVLDHFGRFPTTIEEYFDFIREYKELNPTIDGMPTIGFEVLTEGWRSFSLKNGSMFLAGLANWGDLGFDTATNTAYNRIINDDAKKWFKILNDEFHKGTIPAESLTRTYDQYIAQLSTGTVLGMHDQEWNFGDARNVLITDGKDNRTYLPIALVFEGVADHQYLDYPAFTGNNGVGVSLNCKDPVRFVQYMDYLIQEPVQRFLDWGIEGEHWNYDANGRMVRPEEQRVLQQDNTWRDNNMGIFLKNAMPKLQGSFADGNATGPGDQPEEYLASQRPYGQDLYKKLGIQTQAAALGEPKKQPAGYPIWSMTWEDAPDAEMAIARWDEVQARNLPSLVLAADESDFEAKWNTFVSEMNALDLTPWYEAAQRKYQERMDIAG